MKIEVLSLILVSLFVGLQGCIFDNAFDCEHGRGDVVEENFALDDLEGIHLSIDANVHLTQGDEGHVTIIAQANIIDELDFKVRSRDLRIGNDRCIRNHEPIEIYITTPTLRELTVSGSGYVIGEGTWIVQDLALRVSGSGDIDLDLEADDVEANISGSGSVTLYGEIDELEANISGSGDLKAYGAVSNTADIKISGSGTAEVTVIDLLIARISGSGKVYYRGEPAVESKISGSGKVVNDN